VSSKIHRTAIVSPDADIAADVGIGAFTIVEGGVSIGAGTTIHSHVHLLGDVSIGEGCVVWPGTIIGGDPQSTGFDPATRSGVEIGKRNVIRENTSIHRSMEKGGKTLIGHDNFLMTGVHVGHDCIIGNHNILASTTTLGGHVIMGNGCFIGGNSVIHQFVRIGDLAMFQGLTGMSLDTPPYVIAFGINRIAGLNAVGLRRAGFDREARSEIKRAYHLLFRRNHTMSQALEIAAGKTWSEKTQAFIDFFNQKSKRGYCTRTR